MTGQAYPPQQWLLRPMLLKRSLATPEQLDACEAEANRLGVRPVFVLVARGVVASSKLAQLLCYEFSTIWVSLEQKTISDDILELIPREIALHYQVVPIWLDKRDRKTPVLRVASADPSDQQAAAACAHASGYVTQLVVATPQVIQSTLQALYNPNESELPDLFVEDADDSLLLEETEDDQADAPASAAPQSDVPSDASQVALPPPPPPPPSPKPSLIPAAGMEEPPIPPPPPAPMAISPPSVEPGYPTDEDAPDEDSWDLANEAEPPADTRNEPDSSPHASKDDNLSSSHHDENAELETSDLADEIPREILVVGANSDFRRYCEQADRKISCRFRYFTLMSASGAMQDSSAGHVAALVVPEDIYAFDCVRFNQLALSAGCPLVVWPTNPLADGMEIVLEQACGVRKPANNSSESPS